MAKIKPIKENPHIFTDGRKLYTKNLVKGQRVYGEKLIKEKGVEYREWIVNRSKLAAAIKKRIREVPINPGDYVLYLGIAAGTTASHISDIIGWRGMIFGVDVAPRILRELVPILNDRKNIIPLLEDASKPENYLHVVPVVDVIYQDIAQPHQVDVFVRNIDCYLRKGGYGFLAVKARSIDVTKDPKIIFREVDKQLREYGLKIVDNVRLDPYHKDHAMFLIKR